MSQPHRRMLSGLLKPQVKPMREESFWDELSMRIKQGNVIPIVSNTVHNDQIFSPLFTLLDMLNPPELTAADAQPDEIRKLTIDELLAEAWAYEINYPLPDKYSLPRVAQYNRVKRDDVEQAKRRYLTFMKAMLLNVVERVELASAALIQELQGQVRERSFSDLVYDLDLPHYLKPDADPLRLLARLNLPIYVTTSYYDFLERALRAEGRVPRTQICGDIANLQPEHRLGRDFEPSPATPVVYHLHGLENYPSSLVLSEDDYMDFLIRVTQPIVPEKPMIPLYLSEKLAESTLLLLGYRLQDRDFRATFRGLITVKEAPRRLYSLAIQLSPAGQSNAENVVEVQSYLTDYFKSANFKVVWDETDRFVQTLWREWNRWRQGGI